MKAKQYTGRVNPSLTDRSRDDVTRTCSRPGHSRIMDNAVICRTIYTVIRKTPNCVLTVWQARVDFDNFCHFFAFWHELQMKPQEQNLYNYTILLSCTAEHQRCRESKKVGGQEVDIFRQTAVTFRQRRLFNFTP